MISAAGRGAGNDGSARGGHGSDVETGARAPSALGSRDGDAVAARAATAAPAPVRRTSTEHTASAKASGRSLRSENKDDPKFAHIPIAEQIAAAKAHLHATYETACARADRGEITAADRDLAIATQRAIKNTLLAVEAHADEFRALIRAKRQRQIENDEIAELRDHPAVTAVLDALPGAEIDTVRAIGPANAGPVSHVNPGSSV